MLNAFAASSHALADHLVDVDSTKAALIISSADCLNLNWFAQLGSYSTWWPLPPETPLIRLANSLGKKTIAGQDVIVIQAVEQFVLYTGVRPSTRQIEKATAFARSQSSTN